MKISEKKRPIAIWGTGKEAAQCAYTLSTEGIPVELFLDNYGSAEIMWNCPVKRPTKEIVTQFFIIVAGKRNAYISIAKQLRGYERKEFTDFIYYEGIFDKKMVLLHGNCHVDIIEQYLNSSELFRKYFWIYPSPRIYEMKNDGIAQEVLNHMDVWIHQDIQVNNQYGLTMSDEYIRSVIKQEVVDITIPNLFGLGKAFFPQTEMRNNRNSALLNGRDTNGVFPYRDIVIDDCIEKNMSVEDVVSYVQGAAFDSAFIVNNFNITMERIKEREKNWDIEVSGYICNNYKKEKLFYDAGHPTNALLHIISVGVLKLLGIEEGDIVCEKVLDGHETPIYPCVEQALGIQWKSDCIRTSENAKKCTRVMDINEYVRQYIWWCYGR